MTCSNNWDGFLSGIAEVASGQVFKLAAEFLKSMTILPSSCQVAIEAGSTRPVIGKLKKPCHYWIKGLFNGVSDTRCHAHSPKLMKEVVKGTFRFLTSPCLLELPLPPGVALNDRSYG